MSNFVHEMLHNSSTAERIMSLWQVRLFGKEPLPEVTVVQEYEDQATAEAQFVKG